MTFGNSPASISNQKDSGDEKQGRIGAQVNAELEHQTKYDTTRGEKKPMGERGAYFADHVSGEDDGEGEKNGRNG
ncbi:hypothetical protein [Litoribacter populi]|uniref:hypothetical protein n=1 Tax=Litoribacter populi TaxID=2598460 RepID=UPI00117C4733|nr:hypothetical protein [Litoribacter populi]